MGQRLNVEIIKGGKVLANAYYHWSGYTASAIEITNQVINHFNWLTKENTNEFVGRDRLLAVRLLEETGAGILGDEKKIRESREFLQMKDEEELAPCGDRNTGLIGIFKEDIEETRRWEEARVSIVIDHNFIIFDTIMSFSKEEIEEIEEDLNLFTVPEINIDFCNIPFDKFTQVTGQIIMETEKGNYYYYNNFDSKFYTVIT